MKRSLSIAAILILIASAASAQQRAIKKDVVVNAGLDEVWKAWTTAEGAEAFLAPQATIELTSGGAYEVYFAPNAPKGSRGCEGCKVLGFEPKRALYLDWGIPPVYPTLQGHRFKVTIALDPIDASHVRVSVTHDGLGSGPEWDEVFKHFEFGWGVVLSRLQQRFQSGPLDWAKLNRPAGK
jgi:uncharacterized protein YndB with AHSA1/START domain